MNKGLGYIEFESVEELKKHFKDVYNEILDERYMANCYFWRRMIEKGDIIYNLEFDDSTCHVLKSKIGYYYFFSKSYILYFYIENNKIYTITIGEGEYYQPFETKLYHLIYGPKTLSIPEAFKVLSL